MKWLRFALQRLCEAGVLFVNRSASLITLFKAAPPRSPPDKSDRAQNPPRPREYIHAPLRPPAVPPPHLRSVHAHPPLPQPRPHALSKSNTLDNLPQNKPFRATPHDNLPRSPGVTHDNLLQNKPFLLANSSTATACHPAIWSSCHLAPVWAPR